jgi:hypothetical protein
VRLPLLLTFNLQVRSGPARSASRENPASVRRSPERHGDRERFESAGNLRFLNRI